jgi:hypothetical protein
MTRGWTSPGWCTTPGISLATTSTAACASTSAGCTTGTHTDDHQQDAAWKGHKPMSASEDEHKLEHVLTEPVSLTREVTA